MAGDILVVAEYREGEMKKVAFEATTTAAGLARELGCKVIGFVIGSGVTDAAKLLGRYGADSALAADSEIFKLYNPELYARAVANAVKKAEPKIVLFSATSLGRDLAPNVAGKLAVGMASDCIEMKIEDGSLQALRPVYAGKARIWVAFESEPNIVSLRPKVFEAEEVGSELSEVESLAPVAPEELRLAVKEAIKTAGAKLDLTEAEVIVSGGRGMKGPENYKIIEELAEILGGTVGASRAAVDAGWRLHSDQVGQTGKTVLPTLYIACGISGAIQHLAGMSSSKVIVAINTDDEAPIFNIADYGIVGDLFEVVPVLAEELKKVIQQ